MSGAYLDANAIPNISALDDKTFYDWIRSFRAKNGRHRITFFKDFRNQHSISAIPSEPTTFSSILNNYVLISDNGAWAVFPSIRKRLPMNDEGTAIKADQNQLKAFQNEQLRASHNDHRVFVALSDDGNLMFTKTWIALQWIYETIDLDSGNRLWKWEVLDFIPEAVDFRTKSVFGRCCPAYKETNIRANQILELDQQNGSLRRAFPVACESIREFAIAPCGDLLLLSSHAKGHGFRLDRIQRTDAQLHNLISVENYQGRSMALCDPMPEPELKQIFVHVVQESGLIKDLANLVLQFVDEKPRVFLRGGDSKISEDPSHFLQCVILPRYLFRSARASFSHCSIN